MGTNFYLHKNACQHCGRSDEPLHIGKSSVGWVFGLHVIPEDGIADLADWERLWSESGAIIKDEYGGKISKESMLSWITERGRDEDVFSHVPYGYVSREEFHRMNESQDGPKGLLRRRLSRRVIGYGKGTWDLVTGEFS
jgi:hypothetical protein